VQSTSSPLPKYGPRITRTKHSRSQSGRLLAGAPPALAAALAFVPCGTAFAQGALASNADAEAQALFDDAKAKMQAGQYVEACREFAQSEAIDPQLGTLLNLAFCFESAHHTASACPAWLGAAEAADRKGDAARMTLAMEHAQSTCSHTVHATIDVAPQSGRDRIVLTLNRAPLDRVQWGRPTPLDEGDYELRATGAGLQPWSTTFTVSGDHAPEVTVPVLTEERPASSRPWFSTAAWVAAGTGAVALGASAAFEAVALADKNASNADGHCLPNNNCDPAGEAHRSDAIRNGNIATVLFAVGAGGAASGVLFFFLGASRPSGTPRGAWVTPVVAGQSWGISLGQQWQ